MAGSYAIRRVNDTSGSQFVPEILARRLGLIGLDDRGGLLPPCRTCRQELNRLRKSPRIAKPIIIGQRKATVTPWSIDCSAQSRSLRRAEVAAFIAGADAADDIAQQVKCGEENETFDTSHSPAGISVCHLGILESPS